MKTLHYAAIAAGVALTACASAPEEKTTPARPETVAGTTVEAKQLAAQLGAREVVEIDFDVKSADLSSLSEKQLRSAMERALSRGPVRTISVITWGDEEYPSIHREELSDDQKELVDSRNERIKAFLQRFDDKPVIRTYSMAERPGFVARLGGTTEWELKKMLEESGVPNTDTSVKSPSKATRAIVLFTTGDRKTR